MTSALILLKAIIDPRGRADRFGFFVTMTIATIFAQALILFQPPTEGLSILAYGAALWIVAVPCQRRLHDLNLSGWLAWAVLPLLFIWSVVASLVIAGVALTMGGDTMAMLADGGVLHLTLVVLVSLPLVVVGGWLSLVRGNGRDNVYGPPPHRFGLSGPHSRFRAPAAHGSLPA